MRMKFTEIGCLMNYLNQMKNRITPELITELMPGQIFVFGSNESGRHGKGAAKTALGWGAKWGQASGLQGKTYGIPTKDAQIRILPTSSIKLYIDEFIEFAKQNPNLTFLCTEIGCGLSNYRPKDIAPLFKESIYIENIYLPNSFWEFLKY